MTIQNISFLNPNTLPTYYGDETNTLTVVLDSFARPIQTMLRPVWPDWAIFWHSW